MKKFIIAFALIVCALLTACRKDGVLIDTQTLKVERDGAQTVVYDLAGNAEYSYRTIRVRKDKISDEMKTDRIEVSTDTIEITVLCGGGFIIKDHTANIAYRIGESGAEQING